MSEIPPLPESDDPFEVLGVDPDVDALTLKRAYVRLIKVYRPEKAPEEFARIREAYQAAQAMLSSGEGDEPWQEWGGGDEEAEGPEEPLLDAVRQAWTHVADGRPDEARMLLREAPAASAQACAHRFLLAEALGDAPGVPLEPLATGIRSGAPVLEWARRLLTLEERRELALHPDLADQRLDTPDGARLFAMRVRALLFAGRDAEALDLLSSPSFTAAALDDPGLASDAREAMVATVWTDPDRARSLNDRFAEDASEESAGWLPEDHYEQMKPLADQAVRWRAQNPDLAPLDRYLRLGPIAEPDEERMLAEELHEDFLSRPEAYVNGFDATDRSAPGVLARYIDQVEASSTSEEESERVGRAALANAMRAADDRARRSLLNDWGSTGVGTLFIVSLGSFFLVGWWGFAVVFAVLALGIWFLRWVEKHTYRAIRDPLIRLVLETPITPAQMVGWAQQHRKEVSELKDLLRFIAGDRTLVALAWTRRLGGSLQE